MGIFEFPVDSKAIRIDPTKTFSTRIDVTDELLRRIRQKANPSCQQCKGEGIYPWGTAERKLCRCTGMIG
jgi:hypothetical protein